jgi:hypothetical protein
VRWSGGIRRGMRGMCGPFGGGWAQEKRFLPFCQEAESWTGGCVCSERDTGLTGCILLIREARVAGGFGLGGQDIR